MTSVVVFEINTSETSFIQSNIQKHESPRDLPGRYTCQESTISHNP